MFKKSKYFSFCLAMICLSSFSFSASLEEMINQFETKSNKVKINELTIKTFDVDDRLISKREWNEFKVDYDNLYRNPDGDFIFGVGTTLQYGIFSYNFEYDTTNSNVMENKITASKNINEFLLSEYDYSKKVNNISKEIQKLNNITSINGSVQTLIDLYKNYKLKEKELDQEKEIQEKRQTDLGILKRKYEVGVSAKFDYDLAKVEYEVSSLKLDNIKRELKILGESFRNYDIYFDYDKDKLDEINRLDLDKEDFYKVKTSEADAIKLQEDKNLEQLRWEKFDSNIPKFKVETSYSFASEEFRIGFNINKTFKHVNNEREKLLIDLEKNKIEYETKKNEILTEVGKNITQYTTYQTNELIAEKNRNIKKNEYEIYKKKYELGMDTYSNYLEKMKNYETAVLEYEKARNELAAFTQKIKYMY